MTLEKLTNVELWENLRRLKKRKAYAWHYQPEEVEQLDEMIGEVEAEITRRDTK